MRNPTAYLKMRVLGAVDMAEGKTERARIQAVSQMTFTDEEGQPRRFTWRTISTWLCRHGKAIPRRQGQDPQGQARGHSGSHPSRASQNAWPCSQTFRPLPLVHRTGFIEPLAGCSHNFLPADPRI